jgi:hypothetical protein
MFNFFKKLFGTKDKTPAPQEVSQEKESTQVTIKYSYEWREDVPLNERDTEEHPSRPFCKKMMELQRLYSRADIETISQRLGYSVFDRCGGDDCRHIWKSNIVVKKVKR